MLNVVVFSGGRGTRSIQEAFSGVPDVNVTYILNGYDSGKSTGEIRKLIPGMLGPSDFRKALANIAGFTANNLQKSFADLLEHRLTKEEDVASKVVASWMDFGNAVQYVESISPSIEVRTAIALAKYLSIFASYVMDAGPNSRFHSADLAIGNAVLAGLFIIERDFNASVEKLSHLIGLGENSKVVNVTQGEDLWLAAVTNDGFLCVEEGFFVTNPPPSPISNIFLIDRSKYEDLRGKFSTWTKIENSDLTDISLEDIKVYPKISPEAENSIANADLIIYGTGTLHSSILPSFLTEELLSAIRRKNKCHKILFLNATRDLDFHESQDVDEAIHTVSGYLTDNFLEPLPKLLNEIWVPNESWNGSRISISNSNSAYGGVKIKTLDKSVSKSNLYSAAETYSILSNALKFEIGNQIAPSDQVISIVVPVKNEINQLRFFHSSLIDLNYRLQNTFLEILVVDGGSTDGSFEFLETLDGITLLRNFERKGRQGAISLGLEKARGQLVCVYHADNEYDLNGLIDLIDMARINPSSIYLASRSIGSLEANLRTIYGNNRLLFAISRTGGILLSAILGLRMGRVISDPFSGIFVGGRDIVKSCAVREGEHDAFVRFLLNTKKQRIPVVEVGIKYSPRTRLQGKKTGIRMGVLAILEVFKINGKRVIN